VPSHRYGRKGFTYPNPVSLSAEHHRVYLFWRGEDYSQDFAIRGQTGGWTEGRRLIADRGQRPYVKVDSDGKATIGLAFTDGHPRETLTSVYYAAYRHGSLWTAAGRRISSLARAPIAPRQAQLVYDGHRTRTPSWVWDVALGHSGHPVIVYATFPASGDHAYWYARWDGRQWVSRFLAYGGPTISPGTIEREYSGGMALDHEHPSIVYLSRRVRGRFQIERWSTADAGRSFQHTTVVRNGTDNVRPVVPRGWNGGPMGLLWLRGRYGTYTSYRTSISYLR
jgi:hypothetical protein